jgi:anti-anti-sigma factor
MSSQQLLSISVETVEEARVIRVAGEIDGSTAKVLRHHVEAARDPRVPLLVDLAEVGFIDSTGLRVLLDASRAATEAGWPFFIVRPSDAVQRLVALTSSGGDLPIVEPPGKRAVAVRAHRM